MFAAGRESKLWLIGLWRTLAIAAMVVALAFAALYFLRSPKPSLMDRPVASPRR